MPVCVPPTARAPIPGASPLDTRKEWWTDLGRWLHQLSATEPVEWRLEVETLSPCSHDTITKGLFLHHLLKLLVRYGEPSITKTQFLATFQNHFTMPDPPLLALDVQRAFASDMLPPDREGV